jgi:hypothetical protein
VEECRACATYVAQYEELDHRLAEPLNAPTVPETLWTGLEREWLGGELESAASPARRPAWGLAIAVGAFLVLLIGGVAIWNGRFFEDIRVGPMRPPTDLVESANLDWIHTAVALADTVGHCAESPDLGLRQLLQVASRRWWPLWWDSGPGSVGSVHEPPDL